MEIYVFELWWAQSNVTWRALYREGRKATEGLFDADFHEWLHLTVDRHLNTNRSAYLKYIQVYYQYLPSVQRYLFHKAGNFTFILAFRSETLIYSISCNCYRFWSQWGLIFQLGKTLDWIGMDSIWTKAVYTYMHIPLRVLIWASDLCR